MSGVSVRIACGVAPDGQELPKARQLFDQMSELYGSGLAVGPVWAGDKIEEIFAEMVAELKTPPDGIGQIRAEWERERQRVRHPMLVVVSAWYGAVGLKKGEIMVRLEPAGKHRPKADA